MKKSDSPRVETLERVKQQAAGSVCIYGVECFTLAWTAALLAAFLHEGAAAVLLALAGIAAAIKMKQRGAVLILLGAVLGTGTWMYYDRNIRKPLCAMDGDSSICTGRITDIDSLENGGMCYTLRTELRGLRTSVDWYAAADVPMLQIGDRVVLKAELTRIQPDYRYHTAQYQAGRGKYLRIYRGTLLEIRQDQGFSLRRLLYAYRQRITAQIDAALLPEDAALLCAMVFGDKSGLSAETSQIFNRTGIGHIAAVSGLHLVFFCGVLTWLLRKLRLSARTVSLLQIPAVLLFILLVDASVSVYRAAVMVMLSQSAALFGRRGNTLRSLCLAMFLCTVFTPYVIGSVSFWLSVSGVFGIGVLAPFLTEKLPCSKRIKSFLGLCCVAAAVFPADILLCGESSLIAPISNLIVLPICIAALYIGFFLLLTGGATAFLLPAAGVLCRFARMTAGLLAQVPYAYFSAAAQPVRTALFMLTVLILLLMIFNCAPGITASAMLCAAVLLSVISASVHLQDTRQLRVAVLGGSNQAALVVSAAGSTVIADLSDHPRTAQYVRRYLLDQGITRVDAVLLQSEAAAESYLEQLSGIPAETMLVQAELSADNSPVTVQCGGAVLCYRGETAEILWQGMTVSALHSDTAEMPDAAAVICYGEAAESKIIFPAASESKSGNNLLLRLTQEGLGDASPLAE